MLIPITKTLKICLMIALFFILTAVLCSIPTRHDYNVAPTAPENVYPENESTIMGPYVQFYWHSCSDPNGDDVEYSLYTGRIAPDERLLYLLASGIVDTVYTARLQSPVDTIYWRVEATDGMDSRSGPTWRFVAGSESAPDPPVYISPDSASNIVGSEVEIVWHQDTTDAGEPLYYDLIYYINDPGGSDIVGIGYDTTYTFTNLSGHDKVYWQIYACIPQAECSNGPVWFFVAEDLEFPTNPTPDSGAISVPVSTNLSWEYTGTPEDVEFCDVYFGTDPNPQLVQEWYPYSSYDPPGNLDYLTTYYWKIVSFTSPGDSLVGPVWLFTTEQGVDIGIYAQFLFKADILGEYFAWDEIRARFDSSYAPDGPIDTLQAESVTVNGTAMTWNSYSGFYFYSEDPSMHWLVDGGEYDFEVFGNASVPDLTLETTWLECVPIITYPTSADIIYNTGFTTTWDGVCDGDVIITFVIGGTDTTDVWIEVPNTGSYDITADDLSSLEGYQGIITEVIISYDQYYIDEPGYMQTSEVIMRSTHSVSTIME